MEHTSHSPVAKTKVVFSDGKVKYYEFRLRHQSDEYAKNNFWIFIDCYNEQLKINGLDIQGLFDAIPPKDNYWNFPLEKRLALRDRERNSTANHRIPEKEKSPTDWNNFRAAVIIGTILILIGLATVYLMIYPPKPVNDKVQLDSNKTKQTHNNK